MEYKYVDIDDRNYNSKVITKKIGIVIHWVGSETKPNMSKLFTYYDPNRPASAHFGVDRNGDIYSYVPIEQLAFHANFEGDPRNNNRMYVGIEHNAGYWVNAERCDLTDEGYRASAQLCADLSRQLGLGELVYKKNIFRHNDLGPTECCGKIDVSRIVCEANLIINGKTAMYEPIKEVEKPSLNAKSERVVNAVKWQTSAVAKANETKLGNNDVVAFVQNTSDESLAKLVNKAEVLAILSDYHYMQASLENGRINAMAENITKKIEEIKTTQTGELTPIDIQRGVVEGLKATYQGMRDTYKEELKELEELQK